MCSVRKGLAVIRHIVFLRFNDDAEEAAVDRYVDAVSRLPTVIPWIVDFTCGRDVGKAQAPELASNWDFVVSATFRTMADYLGYATHPEHLALVESQLVHLIRERAALQVEDAEDSRWAGGRSL
jgi:hypothetical protein